MTRAVLGIIGGSGIYDLPGLEDVREETIESPWGEPSAALSRGVIGRFIALLLEILDLRFARCQEL